MIKNNNKKKHSPPINSLILGDTLSDRVRGRVAVVKIWRNSGRLPSSILSIIMNNNVIISLFKQEKQNHFDNTGLSITFLLFLLCFFFQRLTTKYINIKYYRDSMLYLSLITSVLKHILSNFFLYLPNSINILRYLFNRESIWRHKMHTRQTHLCTTMEPNSASDILARHTISISFSLFQNRCRS